MEEYTSEQWFEFVKKIYSLIINDIENISDLPSTYPKLIIMYEFFRLIRGEAFDTYRPVDIGTYQKEIYKMEDEIADKLKDLEKQLDPEDSKTQYQLEQIKKSFSLDYFNK